MRLLAIFVAFIIASPLAALQVETKTGTAAVLRALDTLTGKVTDLTIKPGQTEKYKRLIISIKECRYPKDNPSSDAFAYVTIRDVREDNDRFDAWMIASSPALSALDHPRYDVWLLRCKISNG
ncbi:MAG: DUF2155 domain-containing protein [Rhodobacterales bacterium]